LPVLRELLAMQLREKTGRPPAGPRKRRTGETDR
jgi:hypothetical protein